MSISRHIILAALVGTALLSSALVAQERRQVPDLAIFGEPATPSQMTAIEDLIEQYKKSWGQQDVASFISLHSRNTEWINAYARVFRGVDELAAFIETRLFPAFELAVSEQEAANMKTISIRFLSDRAAVVHMFTDGTRGPSRNAGESHRRTHIHIVTVWQGRQWKIAHTAIMDAR
jgi:uncharacterized protein (TIGR02246 family)